MSDKEKNFSDKDLIFSVNIDDIKNKHNNIYVDIELPLENDLYLEYLKRSDEQKIEFNKLINHALRWYANNID